MNSQINITDTCGSVAWTVGQALTGHRKALTLLLLAYTLSYSDRMILSILFPDIKAEFGLSDTQLGLLGGVSFALFYATVGLPIARMSDQYSRKRIIVASLTIFSLMTAFSGLAAGFISLLLLRIGVGIGEAGVNPASHSIIADYFPLQRRGARHGHVIAGRQFRHDAGFYCRSLWLANRPSNGRCSRPFVGRRYEQITARACQGDL